MSRKLPGVPARPGHRPGRWRGCVGPHRRRGTGHRPHGHGCRARMSGWRRPGTHRRGARTHRRGRYGGHLVHRNRPGPLLGRRRRGTGPYGPEGTGVRPVRWTVRRHRPELARRRVHRRWPGTGGRIHRRRSRPGRRCADRAGFTGAGAWPGRPRRLRRRIRPGFRPPARRGPTRSGHRRRARVGVRFAGPVRLCVDTLHRSSLTAAYHWPGASTSARRYGVRRAPRGVRLCASAR
jgi:hypothetical protein